MISRAFAITGATIGAELLRGIAGVIAAFVAGFAIAVATAIAALPSPRIELEADAVSATVAYTT